MNKKDNSKLVNIFVIIGIIFLIASLVLMFIKKKDDNHIVDITYSEYKELIKKDEYTIILFTSPTCSHCVQYKPYVNYVAGENNLTVYNLSLTDIDYDQYIEIHDTYSVTKTQYDDNNNPGIPTPVTVIVKNGEEVTSILGDIGEKGFRNLLKTNGVIK